MRQICAALCGFLLAFVLLVGLVSFFDHNTGYSSKQDRELAEAPQLTLPDFLDGSWYGALQAYYADHFPGREELLDLYFSLDGSAQPAEAPEATE